MKFYFWRSRDRCPGARVRRLTMDRELQGRSAMYMMYSAPRTVRNLKDQAGLRVLTKDRPGRTEPIVTFLFQTGPD